MAEIASGSIDLKSLKVAGEGASKYITQIDGGGIRVHDANDSLNYACITSGGLEIFKTDNATSPQSSISVAHFGSVSTIGVTDNTQSYLRLDYHSFQMIDKERNPYFYVSDLRDSSGQYLVTGPTFIGDGTTTDFNLSLTSIDTNYTVSVSDSSGGDVRKYITHVRFSSPPTNGAIITIGDYYTTSYKAKAFTFGSRYDNNLGAMSCSIGVENTSSGYISYAEGYRTTASGYYSHAEGASSTTASGYSSHAEGYHTTASGSNSHAEGAYTIASGVDSHAEGYHTTANGHYSHAEGYYTQAINPYSHAEGANTTTKGHYSHAEGYRTTASGHYSHAGGNYTVAAFENQTVIGKYNAATVSGSGTDADPYTYANIGDYAFIIGNGTANTTADRSNALTVDWDGNVNIASGAEYKVNNLSIVPTFNGVGDRAGCVVIGKLAMAWGSVSITTGTSAVTSGSIKSYGGQGSFNWNSLYGITFAQPPAVTLTCRGNYGNWVSTGTYSVSTTECTAFIRLTEASTSRAISWFVCGQLA